MRKIRRFRSVCTCTKYHPGFFSPIMYSVISNDSYRGQWRSWSDCADAQADLGLRCSHMPEDMFSLSAVNAQIPLGIALTCRMSSGKWKTKWILNMTKGTLWHVMTNTDGPEQARLCLSAVWSCGICFCPSMYYEVYVESVSDNKGPDQAARMCRLIWAFVICVYNKSHFLMTWHKYPL